MSEGDDGYMGFATRDELAAFLNELLEAERAGARVALESGGDAGSAAKLLKIVHHDEARWCAMLLKQLKAIGAEPSAVTGPFYEKAMKISPLDDRLKFLNRGQAWVVRKLRDFLPRARDDSLHRDLAEMLKAHEENIALTDEYLTRSADSPRQATGRE